ARPARGRSPGERGRRPASRRDEPPIRLLLPEPDRDGAQGRYTRLPLRPGSRPSLEPRGAPGSPGDPAPDTWRRGAGRVLGRPPPAPWNGGGAGPPDRRRRRRPPPALLRRPLGDPRGAGPSLWALPPGRGGLAAADPPVGFGPLAAGGRGRRPPRRR